MTEIYCVRCRKETGRYDILAVVIYDGNSLCNKHLLEVAYEKGVLTGRE